uniref:Uncharacterized protein n=1 Tax=Romanomermis culicivorax TaxID=13658 RepID=A0A915J0U0_ROMCU
MSNQRGNAQHPSAMLSDKIQCLQSEMTRLTALIERLIAQQMAPPPRNSMPSTRLLVHVQNAGGRPSGAHSGAHLQMCSYHGCCTHNDASCWAQHPNSAGPRNAATIGAGRCYFCPMRAHLTDRCDRPCPHCHQIRLHRATACLHQNPTMPAIAVVSASASTPALLPPLPKYTMPVTLNPSRTPKTTGDISMVAWYQPTEGTPEPLAGFAAQGPGPGFPRDSALEVVGQIFLIRHQGDAGCVVNGLGQEISAPPMGATQRAVRG